VLPFTKRDAAAQGTRLLARCSARPLRPGSPRCPVPVLPAGPARHCGHGAVTSTPAPPTSRAARGRLLARLCPRPPAFPAI